MLEPEEVPDPTPKDHEVRIRVHATTASAGDCELRGLRGPFGYRLLMRLYVGHIRPKPIILGQEVAGEVDALGKGVTRFQKGDQVFGWTGLRLGGYAEYICLPEDGVLAVKPSSITYEEAAPLAVGGLEAMHFLRTGGLRNGQKVLIVGAGGSIGTFAVQLAKHVGAEVTAVDSTTKLDMLGSIGADHVIDFTQADYTRGGDTYDVIFDVAGKSPFSRTVRLLADHGRFLMGNPRLSQRLRGRWISMRGSKRVIPWAARTSAEYADEIHALKDLAAAGKIRSVIDRRFPLDRAGDAHRYVDTGQKKGNVVITVVNTSVP